MNQRPESSLGDTPRRSALLGRLAAWIVVVLALLSGPLWSMAGYPVVDVVWNLAGVTAMLMLLESTPTGAIRLPRPVSVAVLAAGLIWLLVAHDQPVPVFGLILGFVLGAVVRRGPDGTRVGASPWGAAALAWHPILWLSPEFREWELTGLAVRPAIWVGALALIIVAMVCFERRGAAPWVRAAGWSAWIAAGAATVLLVVGGVSPP